MRNYELAPSSCMVATGATMSEEDAFLHAVRASPADTDLRTVYADWLDEHGDPRGEYLRLECELASRSETSPSRSNEAQIRRLRKRLFKLRPTMDNDWLAQMGYRLRLLAAPTARERMDELARFVEFWYGPRKPAYGEPPERLKKPALPYPLARFYAFAGRWPSPDPATTDPDHFFYVGEGGHHLWPLDLLKVLRGGRLRFFMEYQGDFTGLTLLKEKDPPVWIRSSWSGKEEGRGTKQASNSLSRFLITHCLMASLYDWGNQKRDSDAEPLICWFKREPEHAVRIWDASDCDCPDYEGVFYLFHEYILVHQSSECDSFRFVANHREGVEAMKQPARQARKKRQGGTP
jgi:uncharacterized protein (TIGR02996 family)